MTEAKAKSTWWVYLVETDKGNIYTGITTDVERRFQEHCDVANGIKGAKGAKFFRTQQPVGILYQCEYDSRSDASKEEARVKKLNAKQKRCLALAKR